MLVSAAIWIIRTQQQADTSISWVGHTHNVLHRLDKLSSTPDPEAWLTDIRNLTKDNPVQQRNADSLEYYLKSGDIAGVFRIRDTMMVKENGLLDQRGKVFEQKQRRLFVVVPVVFMAAFAVMLFILFKMKQDGARQKATEQRLQHSEAQYRTLIENFSGVIYSSDSNGRITFSSPGVLELTGYHPEEVMGRSYAFLVDPESLEKVNAHYSRQFKEGIRETMLEFYAITRSGQRKWVEQIALLMTLNDRPAGFQCFVRDISEKKALREELEVSEANLRQNQLLLQSILDNTSSIVYVKDLDGRYIIANRRFLELTRLTEQQVIGHSDFDFCPEELARQYKKVDEEVLRSGHTIEIEERLGSADEHVHLLLVKFPLRDKDGRILGISGIATDITERVHYQQQLIAARNEAEDARKMQEQFLANMSHEIRTPMNGIQGMTNLLLETALTPQQEEFAGIIRRCVNSLLVIINDILDFSKIKAGKLSLERIDFRLQDITSNVSSLFAHRFRKKGLSYIEDIDPGIPEWLQGDPHRLNQVLINLVGNAIKFTEQGEIRLTVRVRECSNGRVGLEFSVTDTGIGIPADRLPYIFQSFSQAGAEISRKYGGTGLGLAICQQLLQLQGGDIHVFSKKGEGTTFVFRLDYGCEQSVGPKRPLVHSTEDFKDFLRGRRILVAEDNPVNQKLVDFVLRKAGATVTLVDNGRQAIEYLRSNTCDLIVMDLQMPEMDGYETTSYLRSTLQVQIPILAMTANAINGERLRCLQCGMNDYMSKPFEFREFYQRLADLLFSPGSIGSGSRAGQTTGTFDLSLLEEVGDAEYVQDILNTFLSGLPSQLQELDDARTNEDHEKLFFIAHRLKGSIGMMQAKTLHELLNRIEQLSREKANPGPLVDEAIALLRQLAGRLHQRKMNPSQI